VLTLLVASVAAFGLALLSAVADFGGFTALFGLRVAVPMLTLPQLSSNGARVKRLRGVVTADDLVNRKFHRLDPNELWVTDITEHRRGKGSCSARRCWTRTAGASSAGPSTPGRTRRW
jgi:hypothetical protein